MPNLEKALALLRAGRADRALSILDQCVAAPGSRRDSLGHRAWALLSLGRLDQALRDYDALLELEPENIEVRALRAEILRRQGRVADALPVALDLLAADPSLRAAWDLLAACRDSLGHAPEAPRQIGPPDVPLWPLNPVLDALERGGREAAFPYSSHPALGRLLYSLVRSIRPTAAVETGSFVGYSTLCIAQALEDNGTGHLHAFDLGAPLADYTSPILGPIPTAGEAVAGHLQSAGLAHRATLHHGDSADGIAGYFRRHPAPVGLVFVDGDHSTNGAFRDFQAIEPHLAEGAIVLLHDTIPEGCGWIGPRRLLDQLEGPANRAAYSWVNLPSPDGFGFGVIQRQGGARAKLRWPSLTGELAERLWSHRIFRPH